VRKRPLLAIVLLIACALSACGTPAVEPDPDPGSDKPEVYGTLYNYVGTVSTLNPFESSETAGTTIIEACTIGLYEYFPNKTGDGFVFEGQLAIGDPVAKNDEGTLWEIKIHDNAKWENGDPITVDDVIYSLKQVMDPLLLTRRASQVASEYITIKGAVDYCQQGNSNSVPWETVGLKKIDDYTLQVETESFATVNDVKTQFSTKYTHLVHEPTWEACFSADRTSNTYGTITGGWMSCGPFILTDWTEGSQFVLERNPDYIRADDISLEKMVFYVITDSNTALEMFLAGNIDTVSLGAAAIEQYEDDPRLHPSRPGSVTSICVNIGNTKNNNALGNKNFRKALFYATDREAIAKLVKGVPATWIVASAIISSVDTGVFFRDLPEAQAYLPPNNGYDPDLARQYFQTALDELGIDKAEVTMIYSESSSTTKAVSEFLHKTWPEVLGPQFEFKIEGVASSLASSLRKSWTAENPNTYELAWGGWSVSLTDVANGFKVYTGWFNNKNEPHYNDWYDDLWEKANQSERGKTDNDYRLDLCFEMEEYLIDEALTIPIYETPGRRLINDRIKLPLDDYKPAFGWGWMYAKVVD
jgi:oligopeptide transport system substrate-binding protein